MKKFIEFQMDAREIVAEAQEGDLVLVTIDTEEKTAWFVWYNPNNPKPLDNPANHPTEDIDYEEALELYEQYEN